MRGIHEIRNAGLTAWLSAAAAVGAAERPALTPEILHGGGLAGVALEGLQWHPDGGRLTFVRRKREISAFDIANGRERVLLSVGPGEKPESLAEYRWSPDGRRVVVAFAQALFLLQEGRAPRRVTEVPAVDEFPEISPDGARLAWVRDADLHVYEMDGGKTRPLTRKESPDVRNGRLDWVYEEELAARAGKAYAWSPDSRAIAYVRLDSAPVPTVTLIDFLSPRPGTIDQRFPAPGDPSPRADLGVVEVAGGAGPPVLHPLRDAEYLAPALAWTPDGRQVAFQTLSRRQDRLELRLLDVARHRTGGSTLERTVFMEAGAWVNLLGPPVFLRDGRSFLWLSDREPTRGLYRCTVDGGHCRRLGDSATNVDRVVGLDEGRGLAYCLARPSPRERHLYSVPLDGGAPVSLTSDAGTHEVHLAPGGRAFADVHSTRAAPPRVDAVELPGLRRRAVESNATPAILQYDTGTARWVDVPAADGTLLQGRLSWPSGAESGPARPAVVLVYGGPRGQLAKDEWSTGWAAQLERLLLARGYVVWMLDNRGSGGRGHAFEAPLGGELGRTELADQLAGIEYLKAQPFVDARRLGICGASYGGYMALYAAVHAPGTFRAVAAAAPVTDWRRYDSIYTERYLGSPADNPGGYDRSSILGKASAIRAPLLLIHGTADDNVHLSHTLRLIRELQAAGQTPDLQLHPGESHSYKRADSRIARDRAILAHFDRWLKP